MYKSLVKYFLTFIILVSGLIQAQSLPKIEKSKGAVFSEYWKTHAAFRKKVCRSGVQDSFLKKLKNYRGEGFYLPIIKNRIHPSVFPEMMNHLKDKKKWLEISLKRLKTLKRLPRVINNLNSLQLSINDALKYQEQVSRFNKVLTPSETRKHLEAISKIKKNFSVFIESSFYFQRYIFPVDHFKNRMEHDSYYSKKGLEDKKKQKTLFLLRKLLEDGAPGKSHSGSDKFFRTTLDTLALKVPKLLDWLDEDNRYDLEYAIGIAKKMTKVPPAEYVKRFQKWLDQVGEQLSFYQELYEESKKGSKRLTELLAKKKRATSSLKNYVVNRQLETYLFWSKQSPLMQALYGFETILFNEVGGVDPTGLERRDVLQVVLNRYKKPYYRKLKKSQKLYTLLSSKGVGRSQFPWLNILFNRGEFSFTLYYFKATHETFCPNMGSKVMGLRKENLAIAFDALSEPEWAFKAERYFSRASMTGRIDMSSIWNRFHAIDERAGKPIKDVSFTKSLRRGQYRYLYKFQNNSGLFHVVEINKKTFVFKEDSKGIKSWYEYRNPHYFRYFALK